MHKGTHKGTHKKTHIPIVGKTYKVPIMFEGQRVKDNKGNLLKGEIELRIIINRNGNPIKKAFLTLDHTTEFDSDIVKRIKQLYPHYSHESIGTMYEGDVTATLITYRRTSSKKAQNKQKAAEAAAEAAAAAATNDNDNNESSNEGSNNESNNGGLAGALAAGAKIGNGKNSNSNVEMGGNKRTRRRHRSRK